MAAPRALLTVRLAALAALVGPALAAAAPPKVAVLPLKGTDGAVEGAVERALRGHCQLVRMSDWDDAGKRLFATGHSAGDIAAVASDLGVQVVVTGSIKQDDGAWTLTVSVRHGPTGRKAERLSYALSSQEVDATVLRRLAAEIEPAVQRVAAAPPPTGSDDESARPAPTGGPQPPSGPAATTAPPTPAATVEGAAPAAQLTPWFDVSVGLMVSGRSLTFSPPGQSFFATTVAEGLHIDANVFPLARVANNAVSGLGLGATIDNVFWPAAVPCLVDSMGGCAPPADRYKVRELRWEAGLRWRWNPLKNPDSVDLHAAVQFGQHGLSIAKRSDGTDVGPPDVNYSYLSLGIGATLPLVRFLALAARFAYHIVVGEGAVNAPSEYGPGGANGLRFSGGAELRLYRGLMVRLEGFYERYGLSFDGSGDRKAGAAVDQYYGGIGSIAFAWPRPPSSTAPAAIVDGDGDGVPDDKDRCPAAAGPAALGGCPDGDGDGVADSEDRCPRVPGPVALRGCPDGDGDGIPDVDDECPGAPGDAKNHGCPVYKDVKVTGERIELDDKIFFAYDKTEILPKSHGLLDEVVQALKDHPSLRVRVLGHTDAMGKESHNLELSSGRADAVRQYLIEHGIDAERLEAQGFGSLYPIDSNKTQSGRENNRRVEFQILNQRRTGDQMQENRQP